MSPVEPVEALHTAARRYCEGRSADCWARSDFTGYRLLEAVRVTVEAFTPADLGSLGDARVLLAAAGESAESIWTQSPGDEAGQRAIEEERRRFGDYVRTIDEQALAQVAPLPFRRTLTSAESSAVWSELETRWDVRARTWYPLDPAEAPLDAVAFKDAAFDDADLQARLRSVLAGLGVTRVLELREMNHDADLELDLELLLPLYNSSEGFWTDWSFAWLIYVSHEESLTIGGRELLADLQATWPAWRDSLYDDPR